VRVPCCHKKNTSPWGSNTRARHAARVRPRCRRRSSLVTGPRPGVCRSIAGNYACSGTAICHTVPVWRARWVEAATLFCASLHRPAGSLSAEMKIGHSAVRMDGAAKPAGASFQLLPWAQSGGMPCRTFNRCICDTEYACPSRVYGGQVCGGQQGVLRCMEQYGISH
jgi:hypothetical protein